MLESITAVVTGLFTLITTYITYRDDKERIEKEGGTPPPITQEAQEGEQALQRLEAGLAQYGNETAKQTFALFQSEPTTFQQPLEKLLIRIAEQQPAFAALLQQMPDELPTLSQTMKAKRIANTQQEIRGKQGNQQQSMEADEDITGSSQIIS